MEKVIYIDSVFLLNLAMDLLLLYLTAETLKKTATFFKILSGALLGAGGYCILLCIPWVSYPVKVLLGMVPLGMGMVKLVCRTKGLYELLYGTGYLFTYAFLLGGFLLFLFRRIPVLAKYRDSLLLIFTAGFTGAFIISREIKRRKKQQENPFCKVELLGDKGVISLIGLVDTGNGLIEPLSKRPVAVLEEDVWKEMNRWKRQEKYRPIPFHSIGKEHGILESYEVENIRLYEETGQKQLPCAMVAVFKGKLSAKGDYQILLPPAWESGSRKIEEMEEKKKETENGF